ncbi:unnamed protein product, partial [Gulo gulo]
PGVLPRVLQRSHSSQKAQSLVQDLKGVSQGSHCAYKCPGEVHLFGPQGHQGEEGGQIFKTHAGPWAPTILISAWTIWRPPASVFTTLAPSFLSLGEALHGQRGPLPPFLDWN